MITRTSSEPSCEFHAEEYDGYQTRQEENFRTLIINTVMESFRHFRKSFRERQIRRGGKPATCQRHWW